MKIDVLPPDINESKKDFTVFQEKIKFGLAAVKNVGGTAIESIITNRNTSGPFTSLFNLCERIDLRKANRKVLESLIKCGALDSTGAFRSQMLDVLDRALEQAQRIQKDRLRKQTTMFDLFSTAEETANHNGAFLPLPEWSEEELLSYEKESLGFYISRHPLDQFKEYLLQYTTVDSLSILNQPKDREISMGGITHKIREINTRKGDRMCFLTLEDLKGVIEVIVFADLYKTSSELLKNDQPLLVTGKVTKEDDKDTVKILASSIIPLADAEKRSPRVTHLTFNARDIDTKHLHRLKKIILSYPGDCQTMLHLLIPHKSETVLSLGNEFKVNPSPQFVSELKTIFGAALHSVQ